MTSEMTRLSTRLLLLIQILSTCSPRSHNAATVSEMVSITSDGEAPRFGGRLQNVTAVEGRDAVLSCITDNLGTYKVAWVKIDTQTILSIGDHLITRNYRISLSASDGRVWRLRISQVSRDDAGWYMCQINTDPMQLQSSFLQVVEPPDIMLELSSTDTVVREGEEATLRCVARGHPRPTVIWRKQDGPVLESDRHQGVTVNNSDVHFVSVQRHHMAVYFCVASNGVPPAVSKRVQLQVHFPPHVSSRRRLMRVPAMTSVRLECQVDGFPSPLTYWLNKQRRVIASGVRYKVHELVNGHHLSMSLTIDRVRTEDFGQYHCVAKNALGESRGAVRLAERPLTRKERTQLRKQKQTGRKTQLGVVLDGDDVISGVHPVSPHHHHHHQEESPAVMTGTRTRGGDLPPSHLLPPDEQQFAGLDLGEQDNQGDEDGDDESYEDGDGSSGGRTAEISAVTLTATASIISTVCLATMLR